eukprot:scaffold1130_cov195-Pinguiococcus_pyrenoidosus.AAC.7
MTPQSRSVSSASQLSGSPRNLRPQQHQAASGPVDDGDEDEQGHQQIEGALQEHHVHRAARQIRLIPLVREEGDDHRRHQTENHHA